MKHPLCTVSGNQCFFTWMHSSSISQAIDSLGIHINHSMQCKPCRSDAIAKREQGDRSSLPPGLESAQNLFQIRVGYRQIVFDDPVLSLAGHVLLLGLGCDGHSIVLVSIVPGCSFGCGLSDCPWSHCIPNCSSIRQSLAAEKRSVSNPSALGLVVGVPVAAEF